MYSYLMLKSKRNKIVRAFAIAVGIGISPIGITALKAQSNEVIQKVVPPYMNYLKQTYQTPAGRDIILSTASTSGGPANNAFAAIAVGITQGRYDRLSMRDQYNLLGCHFADLAAFSGSLSQQYATNPALPRFKAPFFTKIAQDARQAQGDLTSIGYWQNCQQIRADYATFLLR